MSYTKIFIILKIRLSIEKNTSQSFETCFLKVSPFGRLVGAIA